MAESRHPRVLALGALRATARGIFGLCNPYLGLSNEFRFVGMQLAAWCWIFHRSNWDITRSSRQPRSESSVTHPRRSGASSTYVINASCSKTYPHRRESKDCCRFVDGRSFHSLEVEEGMGRDARPYRGTVRAEHVACQYDTNSKQLLAWLYYSWVINWVFRSKKHGNRGPRWGRRARPAVADCGPSPPFVACL